MAAVTLSDVARKAGVSPATASRVLNGSARTPAADIAERVRAAAAMLGYIPNAQAQALARSSSGLLGLVVHDIADPYFSSIARGVQAVARERGRTLLLICTEGTPGEERDAVEAFASRQADAIVMAGSRSVLPGHSADNEALAQAAARYEGHGGTVVMIGSPLLPATVDAGSRNGASTAAKVLRIPNERLAADLAAKLAKAGWQRFAVVAGPEGLMTSDHRLVGFTQGLREAGAGAAHVLRTSFNRGGGLAAAAALEGFVRAGAETGDRLCVFAVNDRMAMGVVAGLRVRGLNASSDYGIAGFDDVDTLADFVPELTTVHLDLEQIGREAAAVALAPEATPGEVGGQVMLRSSTHIS